MLVSTNKFRGFTLIEVLLAIAIFAVISLASVSIFDGVIQSEEISKNKMSRLNEIQRALLIMERDFLQISYRSVRIEGEAPITDFIYSEGSDFSSQTATIAFVRGGWTNPGLLIPRSDLQSVAYRLEGNILERLHYNFVDSVVGEEPKVRQLISNVNAFELMYFYQNKWQKKVVKGQLPQAIQIKIETDDFGLIERKFLVVDPIVTTRANGPDNNNSNSRNQLGQQNSALNSRNNSGEQ